MSPGPIATETAQAVMDKLTTSGPIQVRCPEPMPVKSTEPVGTYPTKAPANAPPPTPQPVYPVSNPNSWLGMSPNLAKLVQFGFAGLGAGLVIALAQNLITTGNQNQKVIIDSFQTMQKESREDTRELNRTMMGTMQEISTNLARVARSQERLEAKIDKKP